MDQHSLSEGIVRSYTWGETQLLLFLLVHYIPLLWWWPASGKEVLQNVNLLFSPCSGQCLSVFFSGIICLCCATVRCKIECAFIWSVMKLGADLLPEWRFKCTTRIQWASSYLWKTRSLPCVDLSIAEIMARRRGCADISICFISISDKAFHSPFQHENVLF